MKKYLKYHLFITALVIGLIYAFVIGIEYYFYQNYGEGKFNLIEANLHFLILIPYLIIITILMMASLYFVYRKIKNENYFKILFIPFISTILTPSIIYLYSLNNADIWLQIGSRYLFLISFLFYLPNIIYQIANLRKT